MVRHLAMPVFLVLAAASLAGCIATPGANLSGTSNAPYDPESNPYCGALGTCGSPHPIQLGPHDGAMGF